MKNRFVKKRHVLAGRIARSCFPTGAFGSRACCGPCWEKGWREEAAEAERSGDCSQDCREKERVRLERVSNRLIKT